MAAQLGIRDPADLRPDAESTAPVPRSAAPRALQPTQKEIAEAAYFLWEASFHDADPDAYWLQAERDLLEHSIERE